MGISIKTGLKEGTVFADITILYKNYYNVYLGWAFPDGSDGKESACNAENLGLIVGLGRSPGEGNDNPLQFSCLENPMD